MYTGPHIIKDGLVFGYDTGYGIADNDTATRFYAGKPTTNIVPLSLSNSSWFNEYSSGRTLRSETLFGQPVYEFKSNDGQIWVSPFAFNSYDRSTNDLTLSVYAKNIGSSAASMNTYFGGDYSSDSLGNGNTKSLPADNTWRRYSWTRFSSAMSANYLEFRTANAGVVISCPQLEIGMVVTPTVNGTRSSTASLIDLKETTNINVSNVSFDSTGQPDFDGSDDHGSITSFPHIWEGSVSIETVAMWHDNTRSVIFGNYNQGTNGHDINIEKLTSGNLRFYWDRGARDIVSSNNVVTTNGSSYHHCVFIRDATANNFKFYVDGVLVTTVSNAGSGIPSTGSTFRFGSDTRTGTTVHNGSIPILKAYNKALTNTEVKQNYNAYKNRFDI